LYPGWWWWREKNKTWANVWPTNGRLIWNTAMLECPKGRPVYKQV
jgi:hypothetical protein